MHISYLITLLIYLFLTTSALAEERQTVELEPVVVTASKIEEPISETSASIEVVTRQDIEVKQALTLDEALRAIPGLSIRTFGGADPSSSVNLRGADDNQSIIMIDGVKINPPYSQTPYAGALLLNNIERVEVVKGSYSALYGSEAIGGVINVITRERPGITYSISGGTHKTFNGSLLYSGSYKGATYTLGYERLSTAGFKFSGPYWNNTFLGKIILPLGTMSSLQLSSNYWDWEKNDRTVCCEIGGFDETGNPVFTYILDENSRLREDNWLNSVQLLHTPLDWWDYSVKLSRYNTESTWDNPLDPVTTDRPFPIGLNSDIRSERDTFEMQHNFYYGESDIVTLGFQYTGEEAKKEEFGNLDSFGMGPSVEQPDVDVDRASRAIYLQNLFKIRRLLSFTAGVRAGNGPGFDRELIPRASVLYVLPVTNTRLSLSYGEGIRAPSMEELYHPVGGNPDLRPERSRSLEAGFKQPFMDGRIWLEATGFTLRLKDLIDWSDDPASVMLVNIGKSRIKGVEADLRSAVTERLDISLGYTRLSTENRDTGEELPFRPHYRWTVDIRYRPITQLVLDLNAEFAGESFNPLDFLVGLDGKAPPRRLASHQVVNMASAYNIIKGDPILGSVDFTLKLNNIFGEKYEELPGFRTYGFTFLAGIRASH